MKFFYVLPLLVAIAYAGAPQVSKNLVEKLSKSADPSLEKAAELLAEALRDDENKNAKSDEEPKGLVSYDVHGGKPTYGQPIISNVAYGDSGYGSQQQGYAANSNPSYGNSNPSYGGSKPTYGNSNPGYGESNPTYGNSNPSNGNSNPSYGESKPTYENSKPTYGNSNSGYGESKPTYSAPKPTYSQPQPQPSYGQPSLPGILNQQVLVHQQASSCKNTNLLWRIREKVTNALNLARSACANVENLSEIKQLVKIALSQGCSSGGGRPRPSYGQPSYGGGYKSEAKSEKQQEAKSDVQLRKSKKSKN